IIKCDHNIVSGFGLGIGSCIISGALEELYQSGNKKVEKRLKARPFPKHTTGDLSREELWTKYREDMLSTVGIAIFIFGNKENKEGVKDSANGMIEEFEIAVSNKAVADLIGVSGETALRLYRQVMNNGKEYVGVKSLYALYHEIRGDISSPIDLMGTVQKIGKEVIK